MPELAEATYNNTPVFALQQQRFLANLGTMPATDVFSRSQRTFTPAYAPKVRPVEVTFQAGNHLVTLQYRDSGEGLPPWTRKVLTSLSERWGVGRGWDSYDAKPTELRAAVSLLNYLSSILNPLTAPPLITPLTDGGVQAEWHTDSIDFEIIVPTEGPVRFYCYNHATQQEEEGLLNSAVSQVTRIIGSL